MIVKQTLYESKVNLLLKFDCKTNINPCGWIQITSNKKPTKTKKFLSDLQYDNIKYELIKPVNNDSIQDFTICSFDIECDSSHGDFPNPKKDFKRLATEIYDYVGKNKCLELLILVCIENNPICSKWNKSM